MRQLDQELLYNLPNIEVSFNNETHFYITVSVEFDEITLCNIDDGTDDWIIPIKDFKESMPALGVITNYKEYMRSLRDAHMEQEVIDYQSHRNF